MGASSEEHTESVTALAFSLDGKLLISGSEDHTINVWELSTGKLLTTLEGHTDAVNTLTISPEGETLISGSSDTDIRVWAKNIEVQNSYGEWIPMWGETLD